MSESGSRFSRQDSYSISDIHDIQEEGKEIGPIDYYAILNASSQDIKNSYKRLCMTFHPDKHTLETKEFAEQKFLLIQKAYDVLIDVNKRHIYDLYGSDGLDDGWNVTVAMDKDQLRQEFEQRAKLRKELEEQAKVKSKGQIHLAFDATRLFGKRKGLASILDNTPEIQQAMVIHSWETKVDESTIVSLKGTVLAKNGLGSGAITLVGKRILDPTLWSEASVSVGDTPAVNVKLVKNFSSDQYATVNVNAKSLTKLPSLSLLYGLKISESATGYIQYVPDIAGWFGFEGGDTSCMVGMNHATEDTQSAIDIVASMQQSQISISQTRPLGLFRGKAHITFSTGGISFGLSGDKRLGKSTRVGLGVDCASQSGVSLNFKVTRLGQRLSIPILLSEDADFDMAIYTFVIPVVGYFALDKLFIKSWREKKRKERLERIRIENADILENRRKEAEQAVMLLSDSIARKLESDESREGLVIISALYGKLPPSHLDSVRVLSPQGIQDLAASIKAQFKFLKQQDLPVSHRDEFIDVTIPVQALVSNGQLHISGGHPKSHLIGFYDPCYGEKKELRVTYQFQGRLHQVTVTDRQPLAAPLRGTFLN